MHVVVVETLGSSQLLAAITPGDPFTAMNAETAHSGFKSSIVQYYRFESRSIVAVCKVFTASRAKNVDHVLEVDTQIRAY